MKLVLILGLLKKALLKTSKIVLMYSNSLTRHFSSMFHAKCLLSRLDRLLLVRSCLQNFYPCMYFILYEDQECRKRLNSVGNCLSIFWKTKSIGNFILVILGFSYLLLAHPESECFLCHCPIYHNSKVIKFLSKYCLADK